MKMKKTYAAALAAAMILTAGLSAQAASVDNGTITVGGFYDKITQGQLEESLNAGDGAELHLSEGSTIGG